MALSQFLDTSLKGGLVKGAPIRIVRHRTFVTPEKVGSEYLNRQDSQVLERILCKTYTDTGFVVDLSGKVWLPS